MSRVGAAVDRVRTYLTAHPERGQSHDSGATARLVGPLRVEIEGPEGYRITSDMPITLGGGASAPSPGWFVRAGLAACMASVVAMRAAEQGIELTDLEVAVTSLSDSRGLLGIGEVAAGPSSISMTIRAATDASPDELREVVAWAEAHSPISDALRHAIPIDVRLQVAELQRN